MSFLLRKKHAEFALTGIKKLSIVAFFNSLALALFSTVWALYIYSFLGNMAKVGLATGFLALITFFAHFAVIPLIEKNEKSKLYIYSVIFFVIAYLAFSLIKNFWFFMAVATLLSIIGTIRLATFGIIIKDYSEKKELSKNEGLVYTVFNLSFLVGPLLAAFIMAELSIRYVFVFAAAIFVCALLIFKSFSIKDKNISKKIDTNHIKNFIEFFKSKERVTAYFIAGGVQLWWSLIYGFIPLFMIEKGLSEMWVGYFLFAVVIPLVALEYKFAQKAEKTGFKKMFSIGFAIPAVIALISFFIQNIFIVLSLLVLASIGLAMLEPTIEAYFFKILKKGEENRFYSSYHTSIDVNFFISKLSSSLVLFFLPFKYLFILFALFMFALFILVIKTREILSKK